MTDDPGAALAQSLASLNFLNFSGAVSVECVASRPWASVAFSGARHRLTLRFEGLGAAEAAMAFLAGIEDHQFALDNHVVADLSCYSHEACENRACLILEALTVEAD